VSRKPQRSVWWQMISGMRAYGVAITVIWAMSATTLLVILAIAVPGIWLHAAFGGGAVLELAFSALTLAFLRRASEAGRFDV
jgi:hypothetical protein